MNSQNNPFSKIDGVNSQPPSVTPFSKNTPNTASNYNAFSRQAPTPIQAPSGNGMNPLNQNRTLPQTSFPSNAFASSYSNFQSRPLNQQSNMPLTSSPSPFGNTAQKGNIAGPFPPSNTNPSPLSIAQVPHLKQPYPIIFNSHLASNLPQPLNSKVKNPVNPQTTLKMNSRIKCISAIEENMRNQKNKEMLRVDYYTIKNSSQIGQNQVNSSNMFTNPYSCFGNNQNRPNFSNAQTSAPAIKNMFASNGCTPLGSMGLFSSKSMQQLNTNINSQPNVLGNNQNAQKFAQNQPLFQKPNQLFNCTPLSSSAVFSSQNNFNPFESQTRIYNMFASPSTNDGNKIQRQISMSQAQISEPLSRLKRFAVDPLDHPQNSSCFKIGCQSQQSHSTVQNADKISHAEMLRMISRVNNIHWQYQSHFKEQSYQVIVDLRKKYFYLLELQTKNKQEWQGNVYSLGLKLEQGEEEESYLDKVIQEKLGELFGKSRQNIDYLIQTNRPLINLILDKRNEIEIYLTRKIVQCLSQSPPPFFVHAKQADAFKRKKTHYEQGRMEEEEHSSRSSLRDSFGSDWYQAEQTQKTRPSLQSPKSSRN